MRATVATTLALGALSLNLAGCSEPCCAFDGHPVRLAVAASGVRFAQVSVGDSAPGPALVDTAAPLTLVSDLNSEAGPRVGRDQLRLWDAEATDLLRGRFSGVQVIRSTLGTVDSNPASAILGGNFLRNFSVRFSGKPPAVAFWENQPASSSFLSASGFAVIETDLLGGGQVDASGESDFLGQSGPLQFPATRIVLRACAAPNAADPNEPLPQICCSGDQFSLTSGVDLALVLATGWAPLVLSESAWQRIRARRPDIAEASAETTVTHPAFAEPIQARLASLPRLALVDQERARRSDPGPCVELARARRLETVARDQYAAEQQGRTTARCALPCDQDPDNRPRALNSAGYVEMGADLRVAIVDDSATFLQALRAEIRPEGPEIDGLVGMEALAQLDIEIDYRSQPARVIFSCRPDTSAQNCRAIGRCPRLPRSGDSRSCFGFSHSLPQTCDNLPIACE